MEKLLNVKQLSEIIQVSPKTIYQWTHIGFIPHYKLPKGVRFSPERVMGWLNGREKKGRVSMKVDLFNNKKACFVYKTC